MSSSMKIEERFTLAAPPERVWAYLTDASRVVVCLPGAVLESSSEDGRTHAGAVKVKLGAVTVSYAGTAEFVEVDEGARTIRMEAKGRERRGSGSVRMTMVSTVRAAEGGTEVSVEADVQLAGRIVSFGRGMIEVVSGELFKDFVRCLAANVEEQDTGEAGEAGEAAGAAEDEAYAAGGSAGPARVAASGEALGFGSLLRHLIRGLWSRWFGKR